MDTYKIEINNFSNKKFLGVCFMSNVDYKFLINKVGYIKATNIWDAAVKREDEIKSDAFFIVNNNFVNVILDKVIAMESKVLRKSDTETFYYKIDKVNKNIIISNNKKYSFFRTTVSSLDDFKDGILSLDFDVNLIII
jgi:hypothetical protein